MHPLKPKIPTGRTALVLAAAALAFLSLAAGREKLERLKEDIRRHQTDLRKAETEVSLSLDAIHELDRRLETIDKTVVEIAAEVTETSGRMAAVQADLTAAEKELENRRGQLRRHLRMVYKLGRYPIVKLLVSADDMSDFSRRARFTMALAREDRRLARAVGRKRDEIQKDRDAIQRELDYLKELEKLKIQELDTARGRRDRKRSFLANARSRRDLLQKRLAALKKERAELEALVVSKGSRSNGGKTKTLRVQPGGRGGAAEFISRHGRLKAPTAGVIARRFGLIVDDRYDTATKNEGIDIEAPLGSEVKAVLKGKVIFADWFRGYGKLLIVDHGGGFTSLYAHLGTINAGVGDAIASGQVVGTVGDTGYIANPTLHFEIRKDGIALNPEEILK